MTIARVLRSKSPAAALRCLALLAAALCAGAPALAADSAAGSAAATARDAAATPLPVAFVQTFNFALWGYGSAVATLLVAGVLALSWIVLRAGRRNTADAGHA